MSYLINPGDGRDVVRCEELHNAVAILKHASKPGRFASLYRVDRSGPWSWTLHRYVDGNFYEMDTEDLQRISVKVIDAAKAAVRGKS